MNNEYRSPFINFLPSIFSGPLIIKEIIDSQKSYIFERILEILQLPLDLEILYSLLIFAYII